MKSCLVNDFAGRWYVIPVERQEEFRRWDTWRLATRKDQKPHSWMIEIDGPRTITFDW